jgi:nitroreductase
MKPYQLGRHSAPAPVFVTVRVPSANFTTLELDSVITRRRMCRSFLDRPVGREALERALELATHAPSAGNTQGWAFMVLEGDDTLRFWDYQAESSWLAHPSHPGLLMAPVIVLPLASRASYLERYAEADKAPSGARRVSEWAVPYWLVDTAFATMLFLLGLRQEGLGALFFSLRRPAGPLLEWLGVPAGWEALGAIALGWPSPDDRPSTSASRGRKPITQVVHRGAWGRR